MVEWGEGSPSSCFLHAEATAAGRDSLVVGKEVRWVETPVVAHIVVQLSAFVFGEQALVIALCGELPTPPEGEARE